MQEHQIGSVGRRFKEKGGERRWAQKTSDAGWLRKTPSNYLVGL